MKRITKELASYIAKKLVNSKVEQVKKDEEKFKQDIFLLCLKNVPKEVLEFYKKYPKFVNTTSTVRLYGCGFNHETINVDKIPNKENSWCTTLNVEDKELFIRYNDIAKRKTELNRLCYDIEVALYSLKSRKNIEEQFPEAAKYLPAKNEPVTTVTVNLESIKNKLK